MTVDEAKHQLRENWEAGTKCPCCGQLVKLYKRKLNTGMAIFLIHIYHANATGKLWHHAKDLMQGNFSMDYATLRRWGLIQEKPNHLDDKRTSGFWRITVKGQQFVRGEITVPMRVHLYNDHIIGWDDGHMTIKEALGNQFDYRELMGTSVEQARKEAKAVSWIND